ncbi:hypothetical protein [Methylobacterium oryzisoli]|uniref:hypothetical protein n=1 Tax=Methylobacterium oryzisoli TaxID=3385502 RepID=UPI003892A4E5
MIGKLISSALRRKERPDADETFDDAAVLDEALRFPPMRPLQPPPAQNDDPHRPLCEAVEQDLRAAGFLR